MQVEAKAEQVGGAIDVLLIEDDERYAQSIAGVLEDHSDEFTTHISNDRANVVEEIDELGIDCVVCDYKMPTRDGLEILEHIRVKYPQLPFILITGEGNEQTASEAITSGVTDYFIKGSDHSYQLLAHRIRVAVERHRNGKQIIEQQRQSRAILESIIDSIIVTVDGKTVYVNNAGLSLLDEQEEDEVIGRDIEEYFTADNGAEAEVIGDLVGRESRSVTAEVNERDEPVPVQLTQQKITWDGDDAILSVVRRTDSDLDLTAQKFKQAFDDAPVGITIVDVQQEGNPIVYANAQFESITGYRTEEVIGKNTSILQGKKTDPASIDEIRQARKNGESITIEVLNYTKEGNRFWNRMSIAPLRNADGETTHYVGFQQDVTERKKAYEQRRRAKEAIKQIYRASTHSDRSFGERVDQVLRAGCEFFDVDYAYFASIHVDGNVMRVERAVGNHAELEQGNEFPLDETYCKRTIDSEQVVTYDAIKEGWGGTAAYDRFELGCYIGTRVNVENAVIGTVCFGDTLPRETSFGEDEVDLLDLIGQWVEYEMKLVVQKQQSEARRRTLNEYTRLFEAGVSDGSGSLSGAAIEKVQKTVNSINDVIESCPFQNRQQHGITDLVQATRNAVTARNQDIEVEADGQVQLVMDDKILDDMLALFIEVLEDHDEPVVRIAGNNQEFDVFVKGGSLSLDCTSVELVLISMLSAAHGVEMSADHVDDGVRLTFTYSPTLREASFLLPAVSDF